MPSFTFSKAIQWAKLESLHGQSRSTGRMFDTTGMDFQKPENRDLRRCRQLVPS